MLSGISILCFAASYSVALALEASRLLFRSGVRGALMLAFAGAGLISQTLFLYYRAATADAAPLSSGFDWYLLAAWALAIMYLYLAWYHPRTSMGLFVLPLVLVLIVGAQFADREPFARTPATQIWGTIHGAFLLLGTVAVMFGFAAGLMYLIQAHRLKHKRPTTSGLRLPSLEWLQHANGRAIVISMLMVGIGFVSGAILNLVNHRRHLDELPWSDPVVWRSAGMLAWLVAAALFNKFYTPARQGRKVAYLTVASFVFLAISLSVSLLVESEHGAPSKVAGAKEVEPRSEPPRGAR